MPPIDYFSNDAIREDLKGKTVRGAMVMSVAQGLRILIGMTGVPILARLLGPEDFGLVAMVAVFTNFPAMFVDSGMSLATVQRKEITRQQVSNLFWLALSLGVVLAASVAALSPWIAWVYSEQRLAPIAVALTGAYLFSGLTVQHQALLRRGMQFQKLAAADVAASLAGQVTGIVWAWLASGSPTAYWALVAMPLATALVKMISVWIACEWRPDMPRRDAGTKTMVMFGANLAGFNFVNYFAKNMDKAFLGLWWGAEVTGYYERAQKALQTPTQHVTTALTTVMAPALSRLTHDTQRYRNAYRMAARPFAWGSVTIVGMIFASGEPIVLTYLGADWAPVVPILLAMAPATWAGTTTPLTGWVYMSWGHVSRQFWWGLLHSVIIVSVAAASAPHGSLTMTTRIGIAYALLRFAGFFVCFRGTPIGIGDALGGMWRPLVAGAPAAAAAMAIDDAWLTGSAPAWRFAVTASVFVTAFAAVAVATPGGADEIRSIIATIRRRGAGPDGDRRST